MVVTKPSQQLMVDELERLTAEQAAVRLLGAELVRELPEGIVRVRIVETEAYHHLDPAAHSFGRITPRNQIMYGSAGIAYVYLSYGLHYCFNVVCGPQGSGAAVLIRAVQPLKGTALIAKNRNLPPRNPINLTNGPAKLAQALGITKNLNGHNLNQPPLKLALRPPLAREGIITTTRVGITKNAEALLRFYIKGSPFVSKKAKI